MARIPAAIVLIAGVCTSAVEAGSLRGVEQIDVLQELIDLVSVPSAGEVSFNPSWPKRVANVTEAMRPIFRSLPRTEKGFLEATATHYLLHRFFIDQDGWSVRGAETVGDAAGDNLPEVLLGPDGGTLAALVATKLRNNGLSLLDVAVLATALEILARLETETRLVAAYGLAGDYPSSKQLLEHEMLDVYKVYLQIYVLGDDYTVMTKADVQDNVEHIYTRYPMWDSMLSWVQEVRKEVLADALEEDRGTFHGEVRVLEAMQHRYGRWQNQACMTIKAGFREHILPGTGRMPLTRFYAANIPNPMGWMPDESEEYLQHVGALDTTNPENPSVVMPNYFDTPSNCAGPSKFYDVCCISECESLRGHLEKSLGSPQATVPQIVEIVESMSSSTIEAPRSLPTQLIKRLESVADTHGGHAPLHGRLFLQWMHHAFPAECSMPSAVQKSALHRPIHTTDFEELLGIQATITPERLEMYLMAAKQNKTISSALAAKGQGPSDLSAPSHHDPVFPGGGPVEDLPWSDEEELFIACRADQADDPGASQQSHYDPSAAGSSSSTLMAKVRRAWRGSFVLPVLGSAVFMMAVAAHLVNAAKSIKETVLPILHQDKAKQLV